MLCHQMSSGLWSFIWKILSALLTDSGLSHTLGPPLISAQLQLQPAWQAPLQEGPTLCSSTSELSPEPRKPLRSMGVNTPMYWRSIKGGKSQLTKVPVLRGTVLRLILLGSSARVAHTGNCFLSSFLHPLSHSTRPLTAASNQIIYLH